MRPRDEPHVTPLSAGLEAAAALELAVAVEDDDRVPIAHSKLGV